MIDATMLRARVGFDPADPSHDADLTACLAQAIAMCETYCDRWFDYKADEEEQIYPARSALLVKRYPLEAVTSIVDDIGETLDPAGYDIVGEAGVILRGGCGWYRAPVTVTYAGGYQEYPPDLQYALLAAFDAVWASTPGWGAATNVNEREAGVISKISIVGVGSLDYSGPGGGGGSTQRFASDVAPWGVLPVSVVAVLTRYMNSTVIAGA